MNNFELKFSPYIGYYFPWFAEMETQTLRFCGIANSLSYLLILRIVFGCVYLCSFDEGRDNYKNVIPDVKPIRGVQLL